MRYPKTYSILLETATRLFRASGYSAVSIGEILQESGLSRSSLYHFFPNGKEELGAAVLRNIHRESTQRIERYFGQGQDPVREICTYFADRAREIESGGRNVSVNMLMMEMAEVSPTLHEQVVGIMDSLNSYFYREVERCGFPEELTCELASTVLSMSLGAQNYCSISGNSTLLRSLVQQIPKLFAANGYEAG